MESVFARAGEVGMFCISCLVNFENKKIEVKFEKVQ